MNKILSYYRLCAISSKSNQLKPFINMLDVKAINTILTKEQQEILFVYDSSNISEDYLKYNESIIGAGDEDDLIENFTIDVDYKSIKTKKEKNKIKQIPLSVLDEFKITII